MLLSLSRRWMTSPSLAAEISSRPCDPWLSFLISAQKRCRQILTGSGNVFAHTIARDEPHPLNAPFALDRFSSGALVDEHGAAAVAH